MTQVIFENRFNTRGFYKFFFLLLFICLGMVACSSSENYVEFASPFELSAFLKEHIEKLPGQPIQFQILSRQGEPLSYGLLEFQWVEGGRMSFQSDQDGVLNMQFERDILDYEVMVSPESVEAQLRVMW